MVPNVERVHNFYNEAIGKMSDAEALAYARTFAVGHGLPTWHVFTDEEIRAGKCGCVSCSGNTEA